MRSWVGIAIVVAVVVASRALGAQTTAPPAYVVIVHPKNPVTRLDKRFVADAFLKKRTRWSDERVIRPVDLGQKARARQRFSEDILGRPVAAVRRYWSQLVFSGRGLPPPELASDADVVEYVTANPGAIGYVAGGTHLGGARVVQVK